MLATDLIDASGDRAESQSAGTLPLWTHSHLGERSNPGTDVSVGCRIADLSLRGVMERAEANTGFFAASAARSVVTDQGVGLN